VAISDTKGIRAGTVSNDFPVDRSAPRFGVLQLLQDDHPGSFTKNKAVALAIEWAAGALRLVIAGGERREEDEPRYTERMDHAMGAAGEDDVGVAPADQFVGLADRLRAGGTGGQAIGIWAFGSEHAGQMTGRSAGLLLGFANRAELANTESREF